MSPQCIFTYNYVKKQQQFFWMGNGKKKDFQSNTNFAVQVVKIAAILYIVFLYHVKSLFIVQILFFF